MSEATPSGKEQQRFPRAAFEPRESGAEGESSQPSAKAEKVTARGVTLLVPAYNEQKSIEGVVGRLNSLDLGVPVEVLVVNDGSTDGTGDVLEGLRASSAKLRVLHQSSNLGYGAALQAGFKEARYGVVVITDADATYPENRIGDLLERIDDGAEMAVGARRGENVHIPLLRRPAKAFLGALASYLAETPIPDLNSGLRAIRRDLVLRYRAILPQGFSFTSTITLAAVTNGHRVDYVSIDYAERSGRSKIRPIRDTFGFIALIIRTVMYFNPLKVFYPAGFVLGLTFLGFLYNDLFREDPPNIGDKTVLMLVATIQVLTLGLVADLIEKKSRL